MYVKKIAMLSLLTTIVSAAAGAAKRVASVTDSLVAKWSPTYSNSTIRRVVQSPGRTATDAATITLIGITMPTAAYFYYTVAWVTGYPILAYVALPIVEAGVGYAVAPFVRDYATSEFARWS